MQKTAKALTILTLLLFLSSVAIIQPDTIKAQQTNQPPNIEFQKEYSNAMTQDNRTVALSNLIQTSDGGYVFLDLGWLHSVTFQPATLYKINPLGEPSMAKNNR